MANKDINEEILKNIGGKPQNNKLYNPSNLWEVIFIEVFNNHIKKLH